MITETHYIDCDVLEKITRQSPPAATAGACIQAEMKKKQRRWGDGGMEEWRDGWVDMWVDGWMGSGHNMITSRKLSGRRKKTPAFCCSCVTDGRGEDLTTPEMLSVCVCVCLLKDRAKPSQSLQCRLSYQPINKFWPAFELTSIYMEVEPI